MIASSSAKIRHTSTPIYHKSMKSTVCPSSFPVSATTDGFKIKHKFWNIHILSTYIYIICNHLLLYIRQCYGCIFSSQTIQVIYCLILFTDASLTLGNRTIVPLPVKSSKRIKVKPNKKKNIASATNTNTTWNRLHQAGDVTNTTACSSIYMGYCCSPSVLGESRVLKVSKHHIGVPR